MIDQIAKSKKIAWYNYLDALFFARREIDNALEQRHNLSKQDFALAIVHAVSAGSTWILARAFLL
jgi:hypothetical protein